jgi:hypothetical protein
MTDRKYRFPRIRAKLYEEPEDITPELFKEPEPFVEELPTGSQPSAFYNPRRMRWEDKNGNPLSGPTAKVPTYSGGKVSPRDSKGHWQAFPFGIHQGVPFSRVPTEYLKWFLEEGDDRGNGLYPAIQTIYEARAYEGDSG